MIDESERFCVVIQHCALYEYEIGSGLDRLRHGTRRSFVSVRPVLPLNVQTLVQICLNCTRYPRYFRCIRYIRYIRYIWCIRYVQQCSSLHTLEWAKITYVCPDLMGVEYRDYSTELGLGARQCHQSVILTDSGDLVSHSGFNVIVLSAVAGSSGPGACDRQGGYIFTLPTKRDCQYSQPVDFPTGAEKWCKPRCCEFLVGVRRDSNYDDAATQRQASDVRWMCSTIVFYVIVATALQRAKAPMRRQRWTCWGWGV